MTRRVLFLDIDGVLNSHWQAVRSRDLPLTVPEPTPDENEQDIRRMLSDIDPSAAWLLRFIAKHVPGLEIVISSSWRHYFKLDQFTQVFDRLGLKDVRVVGATVRRLPNLRFSEDAPRIAEIDAWRQEHGLGWDELVILDDHDVGKGDTGGAWEPEDPAWRERFVQTDQRDGLTYSQSWDVIVKFIGEDAFSPPICLM